MIESEKKQCQGQGGTCPQEAYEWYYFSPGPTMGLRTIEEKIHEGSIQAFFTFCNEHAFLTSTRLARKGPHREKYTLMPNLYVVGPGGAGPLYWGNEQGGLLTTAMRAFFAHGAAGVGAVKEITPEQLELVREYGEYYLNAPCWDNNPHNDEEIWAKLAELREQIKQATTFEEIDQWIRQCLEIGIDPY
jgi:hypothetical protein